MILKAAEKDLDMVVKITHTTISVIYSHYYAIGVVDFFLKHHSRQNILTDIQNGIVWLHIDSSLAAREMYLKRGYKEKQTCKMIADNGDILVYDEMGKMICSILGKNRNG